MSATAPSRRAVLRGSAAAGDTDGHLCSLVVHARPERMTAVLDELRAMPGVEPHGHSAAGKIVVTVEAATGDDLVQTMGRIGELDGVLSSALVFQHTGALAS